MNDTKEKESAPELLSQYLSMAKELLWKDDYFKTKKQSKGEKTN
jgi:hypothetical protein